MTDRHRAVTTAGTAPQRALTQCIPFAGCYMYYPHRAHASHSSIAAGALSGAR